ncbi:MAG: hypothetical protein DCO96_02930 [Fluviicola sp. XM-24bin1]|nr:MAG: hypothetical protein DCO96_02930 [Fluviicola sp. XM-24bin1]
MDSATYWSTMGPVFGTNTNTQRNVLLEDFTGHRCNNCPTATDTAEAIREENVGQVFVATIHASPIGTATFQEVILPDFSTDWTNADGLGIGLHFGNLPGSQFIGNPLGTINRVRFNGQLMQSEGLWRNITESLLSAPLRVNIQADVNYFPNTRGMFVHAEVDIIDPGIPNDMYTVVYLVEDTAVGSQLLSDNSLEPDYVHKNIMRDCILSGWEGLPVNSIFQVAPSKFRYDYIYELPNQYDVSNMHLLIYVRDAVTEEIYQVIKQEIL